MNAEHFLCTDCFDHLRHVRCGTLLMFYCENPKCRRFGVLTLGGLEHSQCRKKIIREGGLQEKSVE